MGESVGGDDCLTVFPGYAQAAVVVSASSATPRPVPNIPQRV